MIKNKLKENIIKSHAINTQKLKNLIHLNDLKKLKKYKETREAKYHNYILTQTKLIFKKLARKYNRGVEYYRKKVISDIIDNEATHLVAVFKEYLISGDYSEFLQCYFNKKEIKKFLPLIFGYYHSSTVIFPNYVILEEKKYIYKNIQKKQKIINIQQEQEEMEKKKKEKEKKEKLKNDEDNDDNINFESDLTSKSDVLTSHALNSILNQTNTSNNKKLFGLNNNTNNSEDINDFIEKLKNEEKKIDLKNKNLKNRNKHIISIHKGNNSKKCNNKSNTNTYNTISTKNNTKGKEKEKSNLDAKSFSDKNMKKNYNLSCMSLNHSKSIHKNFILKLNRLKHKNERKTAKNILLELSALNTSRKFKKINYFGKKNKKSQILTEFNKSRLPKKEKKLNKNESIKNYHYNHIKRIKSCYGMNNSYSRNKKICYENTIFSNNSNSSNKNINTHGLTSFKICSTLNNANNNESKVLSSETDKKHKKILTKKNKNVFDYRIINMIYSKRLSINSSSKTCINDSKAKTSRNKYTYKEYNQSSFPLENKKNSVKRPKKIECNFSANNSKLTNPFETRISPSNTYRNKNKRILKYALLSPYNITSKFSNSKLIQKKKMNNNFHINNRKIKFKKDIKKILYENKSYNKMILKNNLDKGRKILTNNNFLTINIDKNHSHSHIRNPIDMKKSIENQYIIKNCHHRIKSLCNQISGYYKKEKTK